MRTATVAMTFFILTILLLAISSEQARIVTLPNGFFEIGATLGCLRSSRSCWPLAYGKSSNFIVARALFFCQAKTPATLTRCDCRDLSTIHLGPPLLRTAHEATACEAASVSSGSRKVQGRALPVRAAYAGP